MATVQANIPPQPSMVSISLLVVCIVFPILGTLAIALRFWINIRVRGQRPVIEDWVCVSAQLASWSISIDVFVAAGKAGVTHTYPSLNPLKAASIFLLTLWIEGFGLILSLALIKISILLFYARIFSTPKFRMAVYIYVGVLIAWTISVIVCQLLTANPIQEAWNPLSTKALRFDYSAFTLAFAGMSIVFDVIVLCFPLPVIASLHMSQTRKVQAIFIFWLGIFCCIASAVRFYYLYSQINQAVADTGVDRYSKMKASFIWATVEPNASIVAACLPCFAPLFTRSKGVSTLLVNFRSLFSSNRGSKADAKWSGEDTIPLDTAEVNNRAWERLSARNSSHKVDIELADTSDADHAHPQQIRVTRDFTRGTEVRK